MARRLPALATTILTLVLALAAAHSPVSAGLPDCQPLPPPGGTVVNVSTVAELQDAVANLASGTTILVAAGSYDLTSTLVIDDADDVAIRGVERDSVVLRGRGMSNANFGNVPHGFLLRRSSNVLIADLTVRDCYYHNVQIQGEQDAQSPWLYNVHLIDSGEQQVKVSTAGPPGPYSDDGRVECSLIEYTDRARSWYTNGVDVLAGANWVLRDNVFRNVRAPVGELAGPAVLMWRNSLDSVVERNLFIDCDYGIALGLAAPDGNSRDGETTYDHQRGLVRNNMIYRSASSPTGDVGISVNYSRDYRIYNNTVILNGTFPWTVEYRFAVSDGELAFNLSDGPIQQRNGAGGTLSGNVTAAQADWFVDALAADLHLVSGATGAIDQAATLADVSDDYDASPRPVGAAPDVGADEYGCALPTEPVAGVLAVKLGADVALGWDSLAPSVGYNVWYVTDPAAIDEARQASSPPAIGVVGCTPPDSCSGPSCSDPDGVRRDAPASFYYQVRSTCGGPSEGP